MRKGKLSIPEARKWLQTLRDKLYNTGHETLGRKRDLVLVLAKSVADQVPKKFGFDSPDYSKNLADFVNAHAEAFNQMVHEAGIPIDLRIHSVVIVDDSQFVRDKNGALSNWDPERGNGKKFWHEMNGVTIPVSADSVYILSPDYSKGISQDATGYPVERTYKGKPVKIDGGTVHEATHALLNIKDLYWGAINKWNPLKLSPPYPHLQILPHPNDNMTNHRELRLTPVSAFPAIKNIKMGLRSSLVTDQSELSQDRTPELILTTSTSSENHAKISYIKGIELPPGSTDHRPVATGVTIGPDNKAIIDYRTLFGQVTRNLLVGIQNPDTNDIYPLPVPTLAGTLGNYWLSDPNYSRTIQELALNIRSTIWAEKDKPHEVSIYAMTKPEVDQFIAANPEEVVASAKIPNTNGVWFVWQRRII